MKLEKQLVGTIGTIPVELPILQIGQGKPIGTIVALQHGGELSPLWIIKQLIAKESKLKQSLQVIPVANPFGIISGSRNEPIEGKNLNRSFPSNAAGDFAARLANVILQQCKQSKFVVDLHTFSRQSPFLVGFTETNDMTVAKPVQKMITALQPDIVWKVNEKKGDDRRFAGSLDSALTQLQIPSIFIEMPNYQMIQQKMITRITDRIISMTKTFPAGQVEPLQSFTAKYIYSNQSGLFEPRVQLLDTVTAGQVIGQITTLPSFTPENVLAPVSGIVMTIKGNDIVRTGSKIGSIGT